MIVVGLTGSIGMGKSTAGAMLRHLGVPVHEADAAVHELLRYGSPAWAAFAAAFPYYEHPQIYRRPPRWKFWSKSAQTDWAVDRAALGAVVFKNDARREKLESVLHPFVQQAQLGFIKAERSKGRRMVALDIPLMFETGAENRVDYTIAVTAPPHIQEARVLARPGMSRERFAAIVKRQMPDGEKCARADFVVQSGLGRAHMMKQLKDIVHNLRASEEMTA